MKSDNLDWDEMTEDDILALLHRAFRELPCYTQEQALQELEKIVDGE